MEDYTTSFISFCAKVSEESNLKSGSDQLPIYRKYKGQRNMRILQQRDTITKT